MATHSSILGWKIPWTKEPGRVESRGLSSILATWCKELTQLKRPWCWERLKVGEEGDDRGWNGWMASPTQWTWVWVNSGGWWCTERPDVPQSMALQSQTRLSNWTELNGRPRWLSGKQPTCQGRRHKMKIWSLGWEDHLKEEMTTYLIILPGVWQATVHGVTMDREFTMVDCRE